MNTINLEFLKSKLFKYRSGWNGNSEDIAYASSQNISRLTDNVFSFTEYNFLPCDGSELDGHYTFYVNYKTFAYCFYKSSYYGSLTYVTPSDNTDFASKYNDITKSIVESKIASKLMGSYFYDGKDINHRGPSLFEGGYKTSLITDYRGYLWCSDKPETKESHDIEAIKKIDPDYIFAVNPRIKVDFAKRVIERFDEPYTTTKGIQYSIPLVFEADNNVSMELLLLCEKGSYNLSNNACLFNPKTNDTFGVKRSEFKFKEYYKLIPEIIISRYF